MLKDVRQKGFRVSSWYINLAPNCMLWGFYFPCLLSIFIWKENLLGMIFSGLLTHLQLSIHLGELLRTPKQRAKSWNVFNFLVSGRPNSKGNAIASENNRIIKPGANCI